MAANNQDAYEMEQEIAQYRNAISNAKSILNKTLVNMATDDTDDIFDNVTRALGELDNV